MLKNKTTTLAREYKCKTRTQLDKTIKSKKKVNFLTKHSLKSKIQA